MTDEVTDAICFDMVVAQRDAARCRIEKLEAAVGGAYSWIDRWAKHVPNCRAPMRPCTCGRDAVMYEASKALEGKDD